MEIGITWKAESICAWELSMKLQVPYWPREAVFNETASPRDPYWPLNDQKSSKKFLRLQMFLIYGWKDMFHLRNGCKKRELKRKRGSEEGEDDKHSFLFFILTQQMTLDNCWHLRHDPFKDSDHCNLAILSHPITCPFIPLFVYFVVFEICVEGKFLSLIMSQDTFWMAWNADELSKLRNE